MFSYMVSNFFEVSIILLVLNTLFKLSLKNREVFDTKSFTVSVILMGLSICGRCPQDGFGILFSSGHILFNFCYDEQKLMYLNYPYSVLFCFWGKHYHWIRNFKCYYPGGQFVCLGVVQYNFVQTEILVWEF